MAQGTDLRSRIVLDGAAELTNQLKTLGQTGEQSFASIGNAANTSASQVTGFARATETASRAMVGIRATSASTVSGFTNIGRRVSEFSGALSDVAGNIIPGWRQAIELVSIGGAAGFLKLFESTAKWGHELEENAKQLGLTAGELKAIGKAASAAGLDMDQLVTGITKFSITLEKAGDERRKLAGELAKDVMGPESAPGGGTTVFRGGQVGEAVDPSRLKIIRPLTDFKDAATEAFASLRKDGLLTNTTLDEFLSNVGRKLSEGGQAADKITETLNKLGASLPVRTLGQQIDQAMPGFKDLFAQLNVPVIDKTTGSVRKVTDAFGDFLDAFAKKSPGEQARTVTDTMGRGFLALIPVMQKGRAGLLKFFDELNASGVDTSVFDKEIHSLDEAFKATNRLNNAVAGVRKSLVVPFGDVFTPLINSLGEALTGMQPQVKAWASGVAADLEVIAMDLRGIFQGAAPQTDFGKAVVDGLAAIQVAINFVSEAWGVLVAAMAPVATALNSLLGADYSARTYAIAAAILYFTGVLPALVAGLGLVWAALQLIYANPVTIGLAAVAGAALLIYNNWSTIGPLFNQLWQDLTGFAAWISSGFVAAWNVGITAVQGLWTGLTGWIQGQVQQIKSWIDWIFSAVQQGKESGSITGALGIPPAPAPQMASGGRVPGSGSGDTVPAWLTPGEFVMRKSAVQHYGAGMFHALNGQRFADGGSVAPLGGADEIKKALAFDIGSLNDNNKMLSRAVERLSFIVGLVTKNNDEIAQQLQFVSGNLQAAVFASGGRVPGSGSGDTVPAWLTPGEFVMRKSSVSQLGLPFLSMLNRGMGSFLPQGHYAAGGLVTAGAGGGGTPVHLHLGGQSFALSGGADVVSSLAHEARRYQLRSAGTKPSWYGGTPGGR